ncbi:hypothetical protein V5735_00230 (plasmid) [Haladaptatus sp. SPP-AMP-3]|uniref:hypothetical protein n=1 Tax=Haladaptatus sp. SPP-AMP-3 TaxID=3121295 RepID=UPI003C2B77DC
MSGAFYGALAGSASVFVAILTALLVNNYVQIKSDRRHTINELDRIEEDLEGLRNRRDDYQNTVDSLVDKRETDYKEKATKQVNDFIESEIPSEISKPIEQLSVDELYQKLIDFHDCESAEDLEDSSISYYHRDFLKKRMDDIENRILNDIIPPFASKYEGKGWDPNADAVTTSLTDRLREIDNGENGEANDAEQSTEDDDDSEIVKKAKSLRKDPLELDEFVGKYEKTHSIDGLDEKTKKELEVQYNEIVDKNPSSNSSWTSTTSPRETGPFGPLRNELAGNSFTMPKFDEPFKDMGDRVTNSVLGLNVHEQQKLEEANENLREKKAEIEILEQRQDRLKREKERLHPEDLEPTLVANVATIILSVVIPIFVYLIFVTDSAITLPNWLWIISHTEINVFLSWFLGLCVVFESIHARINDREPKAFSFYQWLGECLSSSRS